MAQKLLFNFLSVILLSSCALSFDPIENNLPPLERIERAKIGTLLVPALADVKLSSNQKPVVAIYTGSFADQTGQRRSNSSYATFSSAVFFFFFSSKEHTFELK